VPAPQIATKYATLRTATAIQGSKSRVIFFDDVFWSISVLSAMIPRTSEALFLVSGRSAQQILNHFSTENIYSSEMIMFLCRATHDERLTTTSEAISVFR
jgi:hypothetical protein